MIVRDFEIRDRQDYFDMSAGFYDTPAVLHPVDPSHAEITFELCLKKDPYLRGLMIEEGGKKIGFSLLSFTYSNEVAGKVVLLEELYFNEDMRGKGFGKKFMEWIINEYKGDAKRIRLEVTEDNDTAKKLYCSYGFKPLCYEQFVLDEEE